MPPPYASLYAPYVEAALTTPGIHPEIATRLDGHLAQLVTAMNRQLRAKGLPEVDELTPLTGDWLEDMLAAKSLCSD